jgi:hypothetical protein
MNRRQILQPSSLEIGDALHQVTTPIETTDIPAWHKDILDEREQAMQCGEAHFLDWEVAKANLRTLMK